MNIISRLAILYIACVASLIWGITIGLYKVWPYNIIKDVIAFVEGDPLAEKRSIMDKALNDMGIHPARYIRTFPERAVENTTQINVSGMKPRRARPELYIHPEHQSGYRMYFGAMDYESSFWGAVLISPNGETLHTWDLSTLHLKGPEANDELFNLYGTHIFSDGSIIFTQQERGGGIVKVDQCANIVWSLEGSFHHTISPDETGHFWTFIGMQHEFDHKFAKISNDTGKIIKVIDMASVRQANPHLHIFDLQSYNSVRDGMKVAVPIVDIAHGNDIEPLPKSYIDVFSQFEPGDLLISYRTQNLIFVLEPESLRVKWWRIGPWDRQHDADWEADGKISVYSNNTNTRTRLTPQNKATDIVTIDPVNFDYNITVKGEEYDFYSAVNGDHEKTPFNTRMITSTNQGWAFEVDDKGKIVSSFVNIYDKNKFRSLNVSAAHRLPENYFIREFWKECKI